LLDGSRRSQWGEDLRKAIPTFSPAHPHHCQRGNIRGARGQFAKGLRKLSAYLPACEQIDTRRLYQDCAAMLEQLQDGELPGDYPEIEYAGTPMVRAESN